ncbi:formate C-acetyltransferase/glycerol dehydratase family glycyl radical enzyme [Absicoccus porci]|uniref:Formate C-acetyltransferase/glycerol dehydratase family glycyl radical enzyme n=2 Tax=Absicoccus porci TaxID=2486576 RepID=A0A3N0I2R5_9FIRM|nr:formate C-acetyltransferase/glycerol dehydratase family glycyl radical enzyme [Absicoccus porci]RNM30622.1 formate C-acetyltransferase/glycerol dehydratase family glycyl radical enzyme [Absicoccus porci]
MINERTKRLREKMEKRKATICAQRAVLYTQSFQQTEGEPYILRKAKAFAYTLEHMTIYIEPDSLIFGNQASQNFAAPIFPEYSIQWVIDELDTFAKRSGDIFYIDEKIKEDLRSIAPYWKGHTHEDRVNAHITDSIRMAEKQGVLHRGGISMSGDGHIVPDHETVLKQGFRTIINTAKRKLKENLSDEQLAFYQSVIVSLEGALTFFKRYGKLAQELAISETNPIRKQEYENMSTMALTMMEQGARSFYEAVEVTYMIHVLQMIESNGHSFCYGRFDQYIYPYYQKDLESGVITSKEALEIITHMFIMNSSLNKVRPYGHTKFSQGYPLYSNLVVGGLKPDGTDGTNDLTYLCIEAMHQCRLSEPNFSARYHVQSPRSYLRACAQLIRTGCGMPSMFNDEVVAKGIMDLGIPKEDALDYCPIGCVETGVPGKYGHRATGMTYVNWGKVLEIMLHDGKDPNTGICMLKGRSKDTYDQLWNEWKRYLKFYSDISVACDAICDESLEIYDADPLASCFIQNSMKLGKTLKQGGCKYDVISQSNIGPSVVGNSLYTIKKLVYEDHTLTWEQLLNAMDENWQSEESMRIRNKILRLPKFGNDIDDVDKIVADVFDSYLELLPSYHTIRQDKGPEVSCYTMSTSNITSYVPNGFVVGATPDGRMAGSPLNEGCSPTQGTDQTGPTALINSVSKLPNVRVAAGQLLNMRLSPQTLAGDANLERFIDFLIVSAKKGIYHNQFNVVSSQELKEAQKDPEKHTDLIVRVAGYCAQFVSLMPEAQNAIIARTENIL